MHKVRRFLQAARVRRILGGLYLHLLGPWPSATSCVLMRPQCMLCKGRQPNLWVLCVSHGEAHAAGRVQQQPIPALIKAAATVAAE